MTIAMKRINMCAAAMLIAVAAMAQGGKYTLKGTISGADGQTVYLRYGDDLQSALDSAVVKKGKFDFKGELAKPFEQAILYMGSLEGYQNAKIARFALEPTKLTAAIDVNQFDEAVIRGGKTQEESNQFEASLADVNKKMKELNDAYYKASGDEREAIKAQMEPYSKKAKEARDQFIKTHPDSYLTPQFLRYTMGEMSYAELKAVYDGLSDDVKKYGDCKEIVDEIEALGKVQPGCVAPDFTAKDINGKPFTLSGLKGHVVILDFWASWCVPCRQSNPHMLELYKQYRLRGLEMVYVSDDDNNAKAWHKAVEKDALTGEGFHHVLRGLKWDRSKGIAGIDKTNDISVKYAVHSLPTKYLIDKEGKIVGRVESDEWLHQQLERLMGKCEYPFTIHGTVAKAEGKELTFSYVQDGKPKMEKTTVKDGRFQFSGVLDAPYAQGSVVLGEWNDYTGGDNCQLALEQGSFTIDAPKGKLSEATVKGGKAQDDLNEYNALVKPYMEPLTKLNEQYRNAKSEKQVNAIKAKMDPLAKGYNDAMRNYYKTHPDSYLSPQLFMMDMSDLGYEQIKQQYDSFTERVRLFSGSADEIKSELNALANVQPGAVAPDFTASDINGKSFSLSSLKGKVVILDFWASWCVPCRQSNPHMLELYKKYHDSGLEMVYVSDDDSNPDAWRKAVEKDGLTGEGFHHVLRGYKMDRETGERDQRNDISSKYAIHYLPTKYLIDREGRIVCKINEGEDAKLDEQLQQLLKK